LPAPKKGLLGVFGCRFFPRKHQFDFCLFLQISSVLSRFSRFQAIFGKFCHVDRSAETSRFNVDRLAKTCRF
jgi:hypothetical protein